MPACFYRPIDDGSKITLPNAHDDNPVMMIIEPSVVLNQAHHQDQMTFLTFYLESFLIS